MRTPEGKIKDKVKALLTEHGAYQFWPVQMGYGARSLDCLVCHYGRFLAVETKREGKDLTPLQMLTRKKIEEAGGVVLKVSNEKELAALGVVLNAVAALYETALAEANS